MTLFFIFLLLLAIAITVGAIKTLLWILGVIVLIVIGIILLAFAAK